MQRILRAFTALLGVACADPSRGRCRCLPGDDCWPGPDAWQTLNSSLKGDLVSVKPVAHVCHNPTFDAEACQAVTTMNNNSLWRSEQPGAVQHLNWDSWPLVGESCYPDSPREEPCGQGKISLYSVLAESVQDIQKTVNFAYERDVRLVIKNTGHDYLGRSSAPGSLQLSTHLLNDIEFIDNFSPENCDKEDGYGPAVTIGAGVQLKALYEATAAEGVTLVAGFSHTVGAAGGYIQGGGHSPMGNWKGMASDNALEFKMVTATGELATANEYENRDLFWALRGGGGGTFGVVTSVTLRTYPEVPLISANISALLPREGHMDSFWDVVTTFHEHVAELNDAGGTGYYYFTPTFLLPGLDPAPGFSAVMFFVNQTDVESIKTLFEPLLTSLHGINNVTAFFDTNSSPKIGPAILSGLEGNSDGTGAATALGSRLFSYDFFTNPDNKGPEKLTETLRTIGTEWDTIFIGHVVAGGQVSANRDIDSAINPAWRDTLAHLAFSRSWPTDGSVSFEEQEVIMTNITEVDVPKLKALQRDTGAYLNEADANEPDFQTSFWGKENYERLYRVKQKWDPSGLFITRRGVGSEDWDDAGLCKLSSTDIASFGKRMGTCRNIGGEVFLRHGTS